MFGRAHAADATADQLKSFKGRTAWQQWQETEILSAADMVAQLHLSLRRQLDDRTSKDERSDGRDKRVE